MTTQISINLISGHRFVGDDDKERAEAAALAVLDAANTTPEAAHAEYVKQWLELDRHDGMTGLARVWVDAEHAADTALTVGWADPSGASCCISA